MSELLASETDAGGPWTHSALSDLAGIADALGLQTAAAEPLARHTSMGVGGACPLMIWPRRPADVAEIAGWSGPRGLSWRALGGGTNLLVGDAGVQEPVLNTSRLVDGSARTPRGYRFAAGTPTPQALRRTAGTGLDGLVWSAGLPGTIGGAAAGNAGCWGGDMERSTAALEVIDGSGAVHDLDADRLAWSYRRLDLPAEVTAPFLIVSVTVRVSEADPEALEARYLELQERKRERQPVGARNSGCIFRNPDGEAAGRLLEEAGCKGLRVGGAEISSRHANFIVNRGGATSADVLELVAGVAQRVRDATGIELEPEIRRW